MRYEDARAVSAGTVSKSGTDSKSGRARLMRITITRCFWRAMAHVCFRARSSPVSQDNDKRCASWLMARNEGISAR